jgi:hypothetical protein
MTKKTEELDPSEHRRDNGGGGLMNEANDSLNSSEWFGAMVRHYFFSTNKNFKKTYDDESDNYWTNVLVGWVVKIILFLVVVVLIVIVFLLL